jgi:hypothetical protein
MTMTNLERLQRGDKAIYNGCEVIDFLDYSKECPNDEFPYTFIYKINNGREASKSQWFNSEEIHILNF